MDFNTLKTLYEEILQTQAVSEKQLRELRELIKALKALRSDYDKVDDNLTENIELLTTILKKAHTIYQNIEYFETKTNKNLQNLQKELKSTIEDITTQLQGDLDSIVRNVERDIEKNKKEIDHLLVKREEAINKIKGFWDGLYKYVDEKMNNLQNQIETKTEEIFTELEQKSLLQRWGAVAGAFVMGIAVSFIFLIPTIKAKMQADKIVQVVKVKDPKAQEIIAQLNEQNERLKKEIEDLKNSPYNLNNYKGTCTWRGEDNIDCLAIPLDKKYFFDADIWFNERENRNYILIPTIPVD